MSGSPTPKPANAESESPSSAPLNSLAVSTETDIDTASFAMDQPMPLQVDTEAYQEDSASIIDSAYGSDGDSAMTGSVTSSIFNYEYENGRRYHAYRKGQYVLTNDDQEQERLDLQHHIWRLILGGHLFTAPLPPPDNCSDLRILDLGTGTGIWAIDMADEFSQAVVAGIDLSPIQPEWVPSNCRFHVDDYEDDWTFRDDEKFDYIHGRALSGTSSNWARFYRQVMDNLHPGGWIECRSTMPGSSATTASSAPRGPGNGSRNWTLPVRCTASRSTWPSTKKRWMMDAGFEDVQETVHRIPIGPWAKDATLKEIGRYELVHMQMSVNSHTPVLFTRVLNFSQDQVMVLMEGVKREFRNRDLRLITSYRFIRGRKPGSSA